MPILAQQVGQSEIFLVTMVLFMGTFFALYLGFWLWMLLDCIKHEPAGSRERLQWTVLILVLGVFGALAYNVGRRKQRIKLYGK